MKATSIHLLGLTVLAIAPLHAQVGTNFLIQTQYPSGTQYTLFVDKFGNQSSQMPIDPGGARFELWTVWPDGTGTLRDFQIGNAYVGAERPVATLEIISRDQTMGVNSGMYRTRVDQPFQVNVVADGFSNDITASIAARKLNFYHTVRAYGEDGDETTIDRTLDPIPAAMSPYEALTPAKDSLSFTSSPQLDSALFINPGDWRTARGEQTITVWSEADAETKVVSEQLTSKTIQIYPMADGKIEGITNGQKFKFSMPQFTITLNNLYPASTTYVRAYHVDDGVESARVVQGSAWPCPSTQLYKTYTVDKYDAVVDKDGTWTFELVTDTPFGRAEYLDHVTFEINRTLDARGTFTTLE